MNYAVIAASINKIIIGRKTKSIIAALLLAASSAFGQSYTIGSIGPAGGYIIYDQGSVINGWRYLEAAPNNIQLSSWGCYNQVISGTSLSIGSGLNNSNLIANNCLDTTTAAYRCLNYSVNGFSDWYLPSQNEFALIYQNLIISGIGNFPNTSVPGLGNLYWTSSELTATSGSHCCINCNGNFYQYGKNYGLYVRPIRQFATCSSNTITADGPTTFCAGNFVNLTSDVVGGTYQWKRNGINITTNGTSKTFKATSTGSYTCVATCNGTALTSNAISVTSKTNASASVTASGATSFCAGDSVTLNCTNLGSNYSVQWYRTNISMENATAYSQVVKQPGTYKVVTKNLTNGCSRISGSSAIVAVNCRIAGDITSGTPTPLSESEAKFTANELSQGVNIFPNPNNGSFTFAYDGEEYGDAVLQVINSMGQMIYNSNVNVSEGGYTQELQLGDTATKGIYIVRLLINGNSYDSRIWVR